jgi:hypothetical protein
MEALSTSPQPPSSLTAKLGRAVDPVGNALLRQKIPKRHVIFLKINVDFSHRSIPEFRNPSEA